MKIKLTLGVSMLTCALLIATQCKRDPSHSELRSDTTNESAKSTIQKDAAASRPPEAAPKAELPDLALKKGEIGLVLQRRFGKGSVEARAAFETFIKEWHPVGRSPADLVAVFGKPDVQTPEAITYNFDSGYGGWSYEFQIDQGIVSRVVERSMD
jgi:hypothetical protein